MTLKLLNMKNLENHYIPNSVSSRYMDIAGLAYYILVKRTTIYKMVANNSIPYLRINNRLRFDKDQIDTWMLSHGEGFKIPEIPKVL